MGSSSDSRDFAVLRCVRRGRGFAFELSSQSDLAVAADFDFECCRCGTPVGRTSFGFSFSEEVAVGSAARQMPMRPTAHKAKRARNQRFMGGKLAIKIRMTQAVTNPRPVGSTRFRILPVRR